MCSVAYSDISNLNFTVRIFQYIHTALIYAMDWSPIHSTLPILQYTQPNLEYMCKGTQNCERAWVFILQISRNFGKKFNTYINVTVFGTWRHVDWWNSLDSAVFNVRDSRKIASLSHKAIGKKKFLTTSRMKIRNTVSLRRLV